MNDNTDVFKNIESKVGQKYFDLLYSATDCVDAEKFHEKCDWKGPTLTVIYGKNNTIYGGYTSQSWSSDSYKLKYDKNAFLFFKIDNAKADCVFMSIKPGKEDRAITCHATFGPTFGGGNMKWQKYDLQTFYDALLFDKCKLKNGHMHLNGKMCVGYAYDIDTSTRADSFPTKAEMNAEKLIVKRLEVYQVLDDQLSTPWKKAPKPEDITEMRKSLEKFEPVPGLGVKHYNILLIGLIGSGKSSICNTLATVCSGSVKSPAPARDSSTSVTNEVHTYEVKSNDGKSLKLRIIDIRGFQEDRGYEHELRHLLDGRLPDGFCFPDESTPIDENELQNSSLKNEIHLVCFVTGTPKTDTFSSIIQSRIKEIQEIINKKGLPMVVAATKFDELCHKLSENPQSVYRSPKAYTAVKDISDFYGIKVSNVFPIINYINEDETNEGKNHLALQALDAMVRLTRDYLETHKEMAKNIDMWSERATRLHIPKNENEKELVLMKLGSDMTKLKETQVMRVLCVGAVNSGKTSFIDSLASSLTDEIYSKASGGFATGTSFKGQSQESSTEKIKEGIKKESKRFKQQPEQKDKIHCICFVFDISTEEELTKELQGKFISLQKWLKENGIPFVAILTKGDLVSDSVKECKLNVFDNQTIKDRKDRLIDIFHFKQSKLFPVVNYIHEDKVVPETDALILAVFREMLKLGKECLEDMEDENED